MNDVYDNNKVLSITFRVGEVCMKHKIYYQIQIDVSVDLNDGKVIENTLLSSYKSFTLSNCLIFSHKYIIQMVSIDT